MSHNPRFSFKLFVAGDAPNSVRAIDNLSVFCREHLADSYSIEIIDVFQEPKRALKERIFLTPTLVALTPPPVRRIVGTLGQVQPLLQTLGLLDWEARFHEFQTEVEANPMARTLSNISA